MLLSEIKSPRARRLWALAFALSPLALLLGVALTLRNDPNAQIDLELDRGEAIARAHAFASTLGVETGGWTAGHQIEADNDRHLYYRLNSDGQTATLRRIAPEVRLLVALISPDGEEEMRVWMTPEGAPVGYTHTLPQSRVIQDEGAPAARARADEVATRFTQASSLPVTGEPEVDEDRKADNVLREYTYRLDTAAQNGLRGRYVVNLVGNQVTGEETKIEVDESHADDNFFTESNVISVAQVLYGILLFVLFVYGLYRYFRLTQQKEVPHARTLLAGLLSSALLIVFAYQTEFYIIDPSFPSSGIIHWVALSAACVGYVMMGLVFGMVYASGEGDVREAYPAKLTSVDALLAGHVFSRNVAATVLTGAALGAWAFFAERLALAGFALRADGGQALSDKSWQIFGGSITPLVALFSPLFSGFWLVVFGLLVPLAMLRNRRWLRSPKVFILALALVSFVANFNLFTYSAYHVAAGLSVAAVVTALLLVSFFVFDLLTAIAASTVLGLMSWSVYMIAQPWGSLRFAGLLAVGVFLTFLLLETYFLFRGRLYAEADVRPLYAHYLAERVQMQAEESAAREAQVRLMPESLPTRAGIEVAAVCHPAHTVGGDFYDLFPLDDDRLCLFVAEGGGGGLGSALTIAFAKGFLMPRVTAGAPPGDVISSLQMQLTPMLEGNEKLTIAFAVIDARRKTLAYARTGEYPRIHVGHGDGDVARKGGDGDAETTRAWRGETEVSHDRTIREATLQLVDGDAVLFFTDGIGKTLAIEGASPAKLCSSILKKRSPKNGGALQDSLAKTIAMQAKRARRINLDDDLTAVIVRFGQGATG